MKRHPSSEGPWSPRAPQTSLDVLFVAHHRALLRLLQVRGVHPQEVEDVAMEIWIDVQRRLPLEAASFSCACDPDEFHQRTRAWVMAFGRLRSIRWLRDRRRRPEAPGVEAVIDPRDSGEGPDARLARGERLAVVQRALQSLGGEAQRALLYDLYCLDLSQAEAARARGWDESRLRRALKIARAGMMRACRRLGVEA